MSDIPVGDGADTPELGEVESGVGRLGSDSTSAEHVAGADAVGRGGKGKGKAVDTPQRELSGTELSSGGASATTSEGEAHQDEPRPTTFPRILPHNHPSDTASVVNYGPEPVPISPTTDGEHDEDDLETPKASMFLSRHGVLPSTGDLNIFRPGVSRVNSDLSIQEDHFPNPLASILPHSDSITSRAAAPPQQQQTAAGGSVGLASQPTTAISLPEGVLAQQQKPPDANKVTSSRGTSVTGAPSFSSDAASMRSYVPTLDGRGNDIEGMLGEILSMHDGGLQWWGDESSAASGIANTSAHDGGGDGDGSVAGEGGMYDMEDEESSDEERDKGMSDEARISRWRGRRKHFFILSGAGKPVYSRHGNVSGTEQMLVSGYMGVIQTIVSFFQDTGGGSPSGVGDSLRSFVAGRNRFVVVKEPGPLYLVAISSLPCESEAQLRAQLDKLYSQVVATLTVSALTRIFSQREGFDLRRLLGGTEVFLDGLSDTMTRGDPGTLLSALECVRLRKREREKIHGVLLKGRNDKLLYGMVVADGRLVGVVRPRRHSLHPMDLQVVFGMLFNAGTFRDSIAGNVGTPGEAGPAGPLGSEGASGGAAGGGNNTGGTGGGGGGGAGEHWIPVCLPKFNPTGYLYAYIHFWRRELAIVLISAEPSSFFELQVMKEAVISKLDSPDPNTNISLTGVIESALSANRYSVDEVLRSPPAAPGVSMPRVLHFLYKSRRNVQFTMPSWEPHFSTSRAKRRVMSVYQGLHSKVHKAVGSGGLKVHFERVGGWFVLGWVEGGWEVFVIAQRQGGGVGREGLVREEERRGLAEAAGRIVRWVGREEERVFVVGGAVF